MNKTGIPWADITWNPIEGCSHASEGCDNCYAADMAHRFHRPWGSPVFHPERVNEPRTLPLLGQRDSRGRLRNYRRLRIFCCSTSDLGHQEVKQEWRNEIFGIVSALSCFHTFIFLTKRPEVFVEALWEWKRSHGVCGQWDHLWVGFTAENQERMTERAPYFEKLTWCTRIVSVEPALGPVTIPPFIDWAIWGPETGSRARTADPAWAAQMWLHCQNRETPIPFFDKRDLTDPDFICREYPKLPESF